MVLGEDNIEVNYREDLDEFQLLELELEENLSREQLTWHEEVLARKELHEIKQRNYGESGSGKEGGWRIEDTAEALGLDKSTLSLDLTLAKGLEIYEELARIPSKKKAMEVLKTAQERAILKEIAKRREDGAEEGEGDINAQLNAFVTGLDNGADDGTDEGSGSGTDSSGVGRSESRRSNSTEETDDGIRCLNANCIEVVKQLPSASIDLAIVDPPFGLGDDIIGFGPGSKEANFANDASHCLYLYANLVPELYRVMKPGTHAYLFLAIQFNQTIREMCEHIHLDEKASKRDDMDIYEGFIVRPMPLIWVKESSHRVDPDWKIPTRYEAALWLTKAPSRPLNTFMDDVFIVAREASTKRIHSMERPRELMKKWIEASSNPGDLILDPFGGSFVVPHVCLETGRKCISCELDETNYQRGMVRIEQLREEIAKKKREESPDLSAEELEDALDSILDE